MISVLCELQSYLQLNDFMAGNPFYPPLSHLNSRSCVVVNPATPKYVVFRLQYRVSRSAFIAADLSNPYSFRPPTSPLEIPVVSSLVASVLLELLFLLTSQSTLIMGLCQPYYHRFQRLAL